MQYAAPLLAYISLFKAKCYFKCKCLLIPWTQYLNAISYKELYCKVRLMPLIPLCTTISILFGLSRKCRPSSGNRQKNVRFLMTFCYSAKSSLLARPSMNCLYWWTADMSNTTFFTPIPIPNISKEALTIPNTNTNFLMSP